MTHEQLLKSLTCHRDFTSSFSAKSGITSTLAQCTKVINTLRRRPGLLLRKVNYTVPLITLSISEIEKALAANVAVDDIVRTSNVISETGLEGVLISDVGFGSDDCFSLTTFTPLTVSLVIFNKVTHELYFSVFFGVQSNQLFVEPTFLPEGMKIESITDKTKKWFNAEEFIDRNAPNNSVCPKRYHSSYSLLKEKYSLALIKDWTESTDPAKFVHEDLAIAAYLICIWDEQYGELKARESVNFVDLGCGNGLLVYILNQEGYPGDGIDIRARVIWSKTFSSSTLIEHEFNPSEYETLTKYNWILGNHTDELTPWVPYISSCLSHDTNFFLLPCCSWDFNEKYIRTNNQKSVYGSYLEYIQELIEELGFVFKRDVMKIPSTKRTCFVSSGRLYDNSNFAENKARVVQYVKNKTDSVNKNMQFCKREREIKVINGTKVDPYLCAKVIDLAAGMILEGITSSDEGWSQGKPISLNELVTHINQYVSFEELKHQAGGICTILRNAHQVFVIKNGAAVIRDWKATVMDAQHKVKVSKPFHGTSCYKKKKCWFYSRHPQGCPVDDSVCTYLHE